MKGIHTFLMTLVLLLLATTACSVSHKDVPVKTEYDLSKVSFKLNIEDAYMTKDFGVYGVTEKILGIVIHGNVEKGKIYENSRISFVDENGKVLYNDVVFKIEIIIKMSGTSIETKRQDFAESGENVSIYLKFSEDDYIANEDKYGEILESIRNSKYVVSE